MRRSIVFRSLPVLAIVVLGVASGCPAGGEGEECDPLDLENPCPPGDGFAQFCSIPDGYVCVNVCEGARLRGGCELDRDCDSPMTCDNDRVAVSSCECVAGQCELLYGDAKGYELCRQTERTCRFYRNDESGEGISCAEICGDADCKAYNEGERNVCDVGSELPCTELQHSSVCECKRLGDLGDSCESTDECDQNESPELGVLCCLEGAATCGNNLDQCVEDCSTFSSEGQVRMSQGETCQDNTECGAGLFCCLVPDVPGNCDFDLNQSCTCRSDEGGNGGTDCADVTPGNGGFGEPCRNDGDCADGLPCCTSTEVSPACGVEVDLCECI